MCNDLMGQLGLIDEDIIIFTPICRLLFSLNLFQPWLPIISFNTFNNVE